jgi:activator of HSP90 ATPase
MKNIKQTYFIQSSISEVWQALVNPQYIKKWGGGPVKMDDQVGTKFSLWGGSIWGENIKVIPSKKLIQHWYSDSNSNKDWKDPSIVTFELHSEKGGVRLDLSQKNIPDIDIEDIAKGWQEYYLGPLKKSLEK